jgi:hypothetical protein
MPHLPRYHCALAGSASVLMTLGSGAARADVVIDEFTHVGIYENPWRAPAVAFARRSSLTRPLTPPVWIMPGWASR